MTIHCGVQQAEAIRRGFNANSTADIAVDVSTLTPLQRETLSEFFYEGNLKQGCTCLLRSIPQPDVAGLLEWLDAQAAESAKEKAKNAEAHAKKLAEFAAYRVKFAADPEPHVSLNTYQDRAVLVDSPYGFAAEHLDPNQRVQFESIGKRLMEEAEQDRRDNNEKRLLAERDAEMAKAAAAARLKAQRETFLAVGTYSDATLAQRYAAGYSSDNEVDAAIRNAARAELGVSFTGGASDWDRDDCDGYAGPLTGEQFLALQEWVKHLPDLARTVDLYDMHNHAEDQDGEKDENTKVDRLLIAEARWLVGEIETRADVQIGTLPDEE